MSRQMPRQAGRTAHRRACCRGRQAAAPAAARTRWRFVSPSSPSGFDELLEEHIRMASILDKTSFFLATTKIVGTLGPRSRSVNTTSACLMPGMSSTDLTWSQLASQISTG